VSKYDPLKTFLQTNEAASVTLTFHQIESILRFNLPQSASKYRPWWANGGNIRSNLWIDAGWKVESVHLGISVTFRKIGNAKSIMCHTSTSSAKHVEHPKETIGKQGIVAKNNLITLTADNTNYNFVNVELAFEKDNYSNVFANLNGKTLRETLNSDRYKKFSTIILNKYAKYLDYKLDAFLMELKDAQDLFYKQFLNPHGDETYTTFKIMDKKVKKQKGLYAYCLNDELKYIGRSNDPFGKRINQGYGKITPKNCYIDGRSTNCHINSLITQNKNDVKLYVLCLEDNAIINLLEKELIRAYVPKWNKQLY
jgi:predicted HTH domain antitoxin